MLLELTKRKIDILEAEECEFHEIEDDAPTSAEVDTFTYYTQDTAPGQRSALEHSATEQSTLEQSVLDSELNAEHTLTAHSDVATHTHYAPAHNDDAFSCKDDQLDYLQGHEDKIKELSQAIAAEQQEQIVQKLELVAAQTAYALPAPVRPQITEIVDASLQSAEVITIFQEITNKINLFALKAVLDASKHDGVNSGSGELAFELKKLAEKTSQATQKLSAHMHTIQGTLTDVTQSLLQKQKLETVCSHLEPLISQQQSQISSSSTNKKTITKQSHSPHKFDDGFADQLQKSLDEMRLELDNLS